MTSDIQRKALALLADVWQLSPDVRLGQLMAHLGFLGEAHVGHGLSEIEDDELMAILQLHKGELEARLDDASNSILQSTAADVSVSGSPTTVETIVPAEGSTIE